MDMRPAAGAVSPITANGWSKRCARSAARPRTRSARSGREPTRTASSPGCCRELPEESATLQNVLKTAGSDLGLSAENVLDRGQEFRRCFEHRVVPDSVQQTNRGVGASLYEEGGHLA